MDTTDEAKILEALVHRIGVHGQSPKCPMCGHDHLQLETSGLVATQVQNRVGHIEIGSGRAIWSAVIACTNCGFLSHHSLKALGLEEYFLAKVSNDKQ